MIYEMSIVVKPHLNEESLKAISQSVQEVLQQNEGAILIEDDWGSLVFAWPTSKGERQGRYLYFLFQANSKASEELTRRCRIDEGVIKNMILKLGQDRDKDSLVKNYKTPFSKQYFGSAVEEADRDLMFGGGRGQRRKFFKKKKCWFKAKRIRVDWKDPNTFSWLVNEFGKISPARISGVSCKHQRFASLAVKRARQMGLLGHLSNSIAEK